jgi:hypothetical protein
MLAIVLIQLAFYLTISYAWNGVPTTPRRVISLVVKDNVRLAQILATTLLVNPAFKIKPAYAVQGTVKPTSVEDTKVAVLKIAKALAYINQMQELAASDKFTAIAELFGKEEFADFDNIATQIVRSDSLSQEDKVALGTIKRYGVVADAIIMIGGAKGELRSGGVSIPGDDTIAANDDDADEDDVGGGEKPAVNKKELVKYLKLSKDSLSDIFKIVEPIIKR